MPEPATFISSFFPETSVMWDSRLLWSSNAIRCLMSCRDRQSIGRSQQIIMFSWPLFSTVLSIVLFQGGERIRECNRQQRHHLVSALCVLFLSQTQCPSVTHTISNQITIILSVMHAVSLVVSLELCDIAISVYKRRATSGLTIALSLRTIVSSCSQSAPLITCCIDC